MMSARLGQTCRFAFSCRSLFINSHVHSRLHMPTNQSCRFYHALQNATCPSHGNSFVLRGFRQGRNAGRKTLEPHESRGVSLLGKPLAFTFLVSGGSFLGCSVWQYESLRQVVRDAMKGAKGYSSGFYGKAGGLRHKVNGWWNGLPAGQKTVASIIFANVVVFIMWRIPALTPTMLKYFSCSPNSAAPCWSMFFSMFSQYSFLHLAANMYVLWSFSGTIVALLGREQFLAMYLSAGMISAFTSHLYKVSRKSKIPSLGASGAIIAVLGAVCTQFPEAQLSIAFIGDIFPHSFSAANAQVGLIALDTCGVLFGWRFFDHAAHLGGMLFGIWYIKYGHNLIWGSREPVMKYWHKLRGKP